MRLFHPIDENCPHCDNKFVLPGQTNEGCFAEMCSREFSAELDVVLAEPYPRR